MTTKYDIFISYRRIDSEGRTSGRDIARTIKLELEKRKYKVFFDYSEIKDNEFEKTILPAVQNSRIFLLVLSKDALLRCCNEDDWVRKEIETAIKSGCKIIPVSPDGAFDGWPSNLPESLSLLTRQQVSDISMGSLFEKSIEKLYEERIIPIIKQCGVDAEDIKIKDIFGSINKCNRRLMDISKTMSESWKERNIVTNYIACLYFIILLFFLFVFIEILHHKDKDFSELSLGFYVVSFLYVLFQYFMNRRDGIYLLLFSSIYVQTVGYLVYIYIQNNSYYRYGHMYDATIMTFLFSLPFLLSLALRKKGQSTWSLLNGGIFGLLRWKRHFVYYIWCVIWVLILVYKNIAS